MVLLLLTMILTLFNGHAAQLGVTGTMECQILIYGIPALKNPPPGSY